MEIIYKARGQGKTTEIIKKASKESLIIACMRQKECWAISKMARQLGIDIITPRTLKQLGTSYMPIVPIEAKGVCIDNINLFLNQWFKEINKNIPLKAISLNIKSISLNKE